MSGFTPLHPPLPHNTNEEQPSLAKKVVQVVTAYTKWLAAGSPPISESAFNTRMEACKSCDKWDKEAYKGNGKCKVCGCATHKKLKLPTERCPEGRWEALL